MPMQLPLRKIFQKHGPGLPRFAISLSGTMVAALSLVLVACVAWAFFMGYMVGKGQNPEASIQSMTGIALSDGKDAENASASNERAAADGAQAGESVAQGAISSPDVLEVKPEKPYPFSRPEGESVAAWGDKPEKPAKSVVETPKKPQKPQAREKAKPREAAQGVKLDNGRIFDYTYQVAASRSLPDATRLEERLKKAGFKASVRKSGKVQLVVVSMRGTETDAVRLQGKLADMKLGRPLRLAKKPVEAKKGGKGGK